MRRPASVPTFLSIFVADVRASAHLARFFSPTPP
jgi:hypothetical protein